VKASCLPRTALTLRKRKRRKPRNGEGRNGEVASGPVAHKGLRLNDREQIGIIGPKQRATVLHLVEWHPLLACNTAHVAQMAQAAHIALVAVVEEHDRCCIRAKLAATQAPTQLVEQLHVERSVTDPPSEDVCIWHCTHVWSTEDCASHSVSGVLNLLPLFELAAIRCLGLEGDRRGGCLREAADAVAVARADLDDVFTCEVFTGQHGVYRLRRTYRHGVDGPDGGAAGDTLRA